MIDTQHLCNGSQIMGGIILTVSAQIIPQSVMPVLLSEGDLVPKIMLVTARTVYHLAEHALLNHIQHHQLPSAEAAVLQKHKRRPGLLIGFHHVIAVLQRVCAAHFHSHRLTGIHGCQRDFHMAFPCGGNDNGIYIFIFDHIMIVKIYCRAGLPRFLHHVSAAHCPVFINITHGGNLFPLLQYHILHQPIASGAQPDKSDFNLFHFNLTASVSQPYPPDAFYTAFYMISHQKVYIYTNLAQLYVFTPKQRPPVSFHAPSSSKPPLYQPGYSYLWTLAPTNCRNDTGQQDCVQFISSHPDTAVPGC